MTYKAFVSSTFKDLQEHRAHVIRGLRRAGFFVDPMEDWPADSDEPKQFSQDRLNGCHLCVLLVAFRRGFVPDGESRSITQLEYNAAVEQGVDILPFLLDVSAPWHREFDELEKDPELRRWREQLGRAHGVEPFGLEPRSIDMTGALGRWLSKRTTGQSVARQIAHIDWPEGRSPYPGLLSFDEEYAPLFYGRDREVKAVLAKMSEPEGRVLLISGASGSGKSSLVAAGLWRALLKEGRLPGSAQWAWLRMQPGDGARPFDALAWGLKQAFPRIAMRPQDLAGELSGNITKLGALLASHLAREQELVLFIDQLEELFTQGFAEGAIRSFLDGLVATARDEHNRLRVVATIRSEFISRLEESETMLQVLNAGYNYHLGPVSPRILQEMIEEPAAATGYDFEARLVETILSEAAQEPGSLPLVAYTLKQLFERRRERTFTRDAYEAINGVAGAIGTQADQVIAGLGTDALGAFDKVFAELVHIERDRPPTRKRATLAIFKDNEAAKRLIGALAGPDCRVLVTGGKESDPSVEVAHEKLFTAWPRLSKWIDKSGDALRLIEFAEEAASRWHEAGANLQELWQSGRATAIQKALARFNKNASPLLEDVLRPQKMLIERLDRGTLSHDDRLLIGQKLAEFGDPRPGVGLGKDGLPNIDWVDIPAGQVTIAGENKQFHITRFRIARYPVTNCQFETFVAASDGYSDEKWWKGIKLSQAPVPPRWKEANSPRETVSWFEAVAFCRWMSQRTRSSVRLPTEWEWQMAAMGGETGWEYPWCGGWSDAHCNGEESQLKRTTAVGIYSSGVTRQGVHDMAGNVWEWCLNRYHRVDTSHASLIDDADTQRVVRGGSWHSNQAYMRTSRREARSASTRTDGVGFRLAQDIE